ncbi:hypothetical protein [Paracidobacterium acidisoli]|uniref:hypothetical protein n=1 Tax=Paracidobacterium acidisoli TaxID=2303751 RepID=UPI0013148E10|nr:hypothetical protein [Paracidobacterium acidisoli]MBT9331013.1 hypothetical protein [Paracidobacterium acidisoli]
MQLPEWWHLLSLDAPTVAVLWAWSFARVVHVHLSPASLAILGLGTWLVYVADRILDGLRPKSILILRRRHFFHARYRLAFLLAALAAGTTLVWLIFNRMLPVARLEDYWLFGAALLYFAVIHLLGGLQNINIERWFPKELAVGLLFALATAVPAQSRMLQTHLTASADFGAHTILALPVFLFGALCCLNCLAIEAWESLPHAQHASASAAHQRRPLVRWAQQHLSWMILFVGGMAAALMLLSHRSAPAAGRLYCAALASAAVLGLLHIRRNRLSILSLRIAADAALLTPLLLMLPLHLI